MVHVHIQLHFCSKIHFVEVMLHFNQNKRVTLKSNHIAALLVTIHLTFNYTLNKNTLLNQKEILADKFDRKLYFANRMYINTK
jgi:hypothetical protein